MSSGSQVQSKIVNQSDSFLHHCDTNIETEKFILLLHFGKRQVENNYSWTNISKTDFLVMIHILLILPKLAIGALPIAVLQHPVSVKLYNSYFYDIFTVFAFNSLSENVYGIFINSIIKVSKTLAVWNAKDKLFIFTWFIRFCSWDFQGNRIVIISWITISKCMALRTSIHLYRKYRKYQVSNS